MRSMELEDRISGFFRISSRDERISTSHLAIYMALCAAHIISGFENPFSVTRREIMQACKIFGNATYHKCMKELHIFGYITYMPSYHPSRGSLIRLNEFSSLINA